MDELMRSNGIKSKARLQLVRRPATLSQYGALASIGVPSDRSTPPSTAPAADPGLAGPRPEEIGCSAYDSGCLISSSDAVISRRLQEQTRIVLATLTPREQLVLRLRFGIAQNGDQPLEKIDEVLTPDQIAFIEATALRKLRHPSQGARLRSVDRR